MEQAPPFLGPWSGPIKAALKHTRMPTLYCIFLQKGVQWPPTDNCSIARDGDIGRFIDALNLSAMTSLTPKSSRNIKVQDLFQRGSFLDPAYIWIPLKQNPNVIQTIIQTVVWLPGWYALSSVSYLCPHNISSSAEHKRCISIPF